MQMFFEEVQVLKDLKAKFAEKWCLFLDKIGDLLIRVILIRFRGAFEDLSFEYLFECEIMH